MLDYICADVLKEVTDKTQKETSIRVPYALKNELAKAVIGSVPSVEIVWFTNSDTEACAGISQLFRAFTKRETFIKFEGYHHDHGNAFLVQAGSIAIALGFPNSPLVTKSFKN